MYRTRAGSGVLLLLRPVELSITERRIARFCYSASAMQSAVLARWILSVRHIPVLCPEVQRNRDTIVWFSASGRTIPLVSGKAKFIRIFAGDHPHRGR